MTALTRKTARRRYAVIALWIPLLMFAALLIAQLVLLPLLPDPVATHWQLSGTPDGFSPRWALPFLTAGPAVVVTVLVAAVPFLTDADPRMARGGAMSYRVMAAIAWAETAFIGALMLTTFVAQLGLDDARDASVPGWWALVGLAAAGVLVPIAFCITTEPPRAEREIETPAPLPLGSAEQAVWLKTVWMSRIGVTVLGALLAVSIVTMLLVATGTAAAGSPVDGGVLLALGLLLLVAVLAATNTVFRVRIDDAGLEVRAPIGWPRIRIPRERIRSAEVVQVNPMGEYGGWGWRYGTGGSGWGVVLRTGEAIRVVRTDGRPFTVTVDDAETGAALLNGLIQRSR